MNIHIHIYICVDPPPPAGACIVAQVRARAHNLYDANLQRTSEILLSGYNSRSR